MGIALDDRVRPYIAPRPTEPYDIPEPDPISPSAAGAAVAWAIGRQHLPGNARLAAHMREWLCTAAPDDVVDALLRVALDPDDDSIPESTQTALQVQAAKIMRTTA